MMYTVQGTRLKNEHEQPFSAPVGASSEIEAIHSFLREVPYEEFEVNEVSRKYT